MSNVSQSGQIIVIDDDEIRMETEIDRIDRSKNDTTFVYPKEPDLRQNLESEAEQSNSHKSDPFNSDSNFDFQVENISQRLTHSITAMLGSIHGMSFEDVNKIMVKEKGAMFQLHDAVKTVSKVFNDFSNKEMPMNFQREFMSSSSNVDMSRNIIANREILTNNVLNTQVNNEILMNIQRAKKDKETSNKELQGNVQQDNNDEASENLQNIAVEASSSETRLPLNNVPNQENSYVVQTKDKEESSSTIRSSGIKIGDNWELPIIVMDSDCENEVIEIDSDEEEIQEFREMMSLEDVDCIEIGKDEFEVVVNAKKGDNEITDDYETDDESFIPIMPGVTRKARNAGKRRRYARIRDARRRITISADAVHYLQDDDPSKWRKDLPPFPIITDGTLRLWATGFLTYRKEWERLEYLGDKVLMFCVLRFATTKYLQYYTPSDIKVVTTFLVSNKLLAAYSLTLGLDKQNQMQQLGITKKVADAFEAYIGAYYLSDGEAATTRYLEHLMSPLFELVLSNIQTGRDPHKIMNVMASYFNMGFLIRVPRLAK